MKLKDTTDNKLMKTHLMTMQNKILQWYKKNSYKLIFT